jgi:hypothetical protein
MRVVVVVAIDPIGRPVIVEGITWIMVVEEETPVVRHELEEVVGGPFPTTGGLRRRTVGVVVGEMMDPSNMRVSMKTGPRGHKKIHFGGHGKKVAIELYNNNYIVIII